MPETPRSGFLPVASLGVSDKDLPSFLITMGGLILIVAICYHFGWGMEEPKEKKEKKD